MTYYEEVKFNSITKKLFHSIKINNSLTTGCIRQHFVEILLTYNCQVMNIRNMNRYDSALEKLQYKEMS